MPKTPKDPRSTGRTRGRAVLEKTGRPYWCDTCKRSPTDPKAPGGHYPGMSQLQVQHINKNVLDNDPANLKWLCASCHKFEDSKTARGVSPIDDEFGYHPGLPQFISNNQEKE